MNKKGFTLIEILVVIGLIAVAAAIVIVAINPSRQIAQSSNAQRKSDIFSVLHAIYQKDLDDEGSYVQSLDTTSRMIGTDATGCNVECGIGLGMASGGLIAYGENGQVTPRYRLWDGTDLEAAESSAIAGEAGHGEPYFMDLASALTRDEKILVEQTSAGHVRAMVWDGTSWSLGGNAPANGDFATFAKSSPTARAYGIGYEATSGDALLVYEDSSVNNKTFKYAIWDGTDWSNSVTVDYGAICPGGPINAQIEWLKLEPQSNGNDMILWLSDRNNKDLFLLVWDGNADTWGDCTNPDDNVGDITGRDDGIPKESFDLAWETNSQDGMVVWERYAGYQFVTFSGGTWSGVETVTDMGGHAPQNMEIAADPSSDYIAFIGADRQDELQHEVEVRIWDGSAWSLTFPGPLGDDWLLPGAEIVNTKRVAVVWEEKSDQALFAFVREDATSADYFIYDRSDNTFTCPETGQVVTDLDFVEGSNGPCSTSGFYDWKDDVGPVRLKADLASNDIILMAANDETSGIQLEILKWDGNTNSFSVPAANIPEMDLSPGVFVDPQAYPFDFAPWSVSVAVVVTTADACLDLTSDLINDGYLADIPYDPKDGSDQKTYYAIRKTSGGRVSIAACSAELDETVELTR